MCRCRLKALPVRFICLPHSLFTLLANNRFHSVLSNPLKSESSSYFGVELQWIFIWAKNKFKLWNECRCASFPRVTKSCCEKKKLLFCCSMLVHSTGKFSVFHCFKFNWFIAQRFCRPLGELETGFYFISNLNIDRHRRRMSLGKGATFSSSEWINIQPTEMVAWLSSTRN